MKKYTIKNCDCYGFGDACLSNNANRLYCKDITDCLLKQIADKCNKATHDDLIPSCDVFKTADDVSQLYGRANLANEILQLLKIEECERWAE